MKRLIAIFLTLMTFCIVAAAGLATAIMGVSIWWALGYVVYSLLIGAV